MPVSRLDFLRHRSAHTLSDAEIERYRISTKRIRAIDEALANGDLTRNNARKWLHSHHYPESELDAWVELVEVHAANLEETKRLLG